jgi:hypothetical protein
MRLELCGAHLYCEDQGWSYVELTFSKKIEAGSYVELTSAGLNRAEAVWSIFACPEILREPERGGPLVSTPR